MAHEVCYVKPEGKRECMDRIEIDLAPLDRGNYVEWCVDYTSEDGQTAHVEFFVVLQGTIEERKDQLVTAAIEAIRPQIEALGKTTDQPFNVLMPFWPGG
jgi:hypothetical protein